jgi:hypothetical protein
LLNDHGGKAVSDVADLGHNGRLPTGITADKPNNVTMPSRSYAVPDKLKIEVMATHGAEDITEDDWRFWDASWELIDLAQVHWDRFLLNQSSPDPSQGPEVIYAVPFHEITAWSAWCPAPDELRSTAPKSLPF